MSLKETLGLTLPDSPAEKSWSVREFYIIVLKLGDSIADFSTRALDRLS